MPEAPSVAATLAARIHAPRLRVNVAQDAFMGIVMAGVVLVPTCLTILVVANTDSFAAVFDGGFVAATTFCGALGLLSATAVACLAITVLADPGLVFPDVPYEPQRAGWPQHGVPPLDEFLQQQFEASDEVHLCRLCKVFVKRFDHHCGIVGACIGKHNMWSFIAFLGSAATLCLIGFVGNCCFLSTQLRRPTSLTVAGFREVLTFPVQAALFSCFVAVYGGLYCAMLCGVYLSYVVNGTDSVARRYRSAGLPPLPASAGGRLWRCIGEARRLRTSYRTVQDAIEVALSSA